MTFDELMKQVLSILPNALVDDGQDGEIVISTGLRMDANNNLVPVE